MIAIVAATFTQALAYALAQHWPMWQWTYGVTPRSVRVVALPIKEH